MSKVNFYHLTSTENSIKHLSALLQKMTESGYRILIVCENNEEKKRIDQRLWTYTPDAFLPHLMDEDISSQDIIADCPIFISTSLENKYNANALVFYSEKGVNNITQQAGKDNKYNYDMLIFVYMERTEKAEEIQTNFAALFPEEEKKYFLEKNSGWNLLANNVI